MQPPDVFSKKKVFLEILQNSQENTCAREMSKNTFSTEHLRTTASEHGYFRTF